MCDTEMETKVTPQIPILLGEQLDKEIEFSRKRTLDLCIRKAKAEAAGLLNFPVKELQSFILW